MFAELAITPLQALVFGILTLPVTVWVIYTDVTEMKIKNLAVLAMLAVFAVAGLFLMPLAEYGWRWTHFGIVLVVGYLLSATLGFGAGDMKYMAAVAPFVPVGDAMPLAMLFVAFSILLLVLFFGARRSNALRAGAPDWIWLNDQAHGKAHKLKTPFGVALAPTVSTYFFLGAIA
ncbi:prepilin peptidase [Jannaschia seohaensis]|uniref:Prepilin peptidase CpaA n=1 Tax=Jannaschia seohaensis TaxID=475081 RepID=A0A2Y9B090_9RHOB|nr:prepilin peptidase [Jannaschia seohaensis]PWJ15022.1 prepilin peptidase CpaA [Jannaschia seohaensis]SSA49871.1 prepilin peptidase CpaA [Jannaschia seohaensis]